MTFCYDHFSVAPSYYQSQSGLVFVLNRNPKFNSVNSQRSFNRTVRTRNDPLYFGNNFLLSSIIGSLGLDWDQITYCVLLRFFFCPVAFLGLVVPSCVFISSFSVYVCPSGVFYLEFRLVSMTQSPFTSHFINALMGEVLMLLLCMVFSAL